MEKNDVELIQSILSGDEDAFSELFRKYQKRIHAFVWRKIGDFHFAEEITQDTFLQAHKKLTSLENPNQFIGWIHVIADRLCTAWLRKKKMSIQSLETISEEALEKTAYANYIAEQREAASAESRREIVDSLLQMLPESERTVIILHYLGEMSCEAIGKFLSVSPNTVKSRLQRGRNRLNRLMLKTSKRRTDIMNTAHTDISNIKFIDLQRNINKREQEISRLMKQHSIPTEWFDAEFRPETYNFRTDAVKNAYTTIVRYQQEICQYIDAFCISRNSLKARGEIDTRVVEAHDAKMAIVNAHLWLVVRIAKHFRKKAHGVEFLDIIQEGTIALMKAIDNFDYQSGYKFKTYATWWIRQGIVRAMTKQEDTSHSEE